MAEIRRITSKEEYKIIVLRDAMKVSDIVELYKEGKIDGTQYVFKIENIQKVCQLVAKGFWCMALEKAKCFTKRMADDGTRVCNKIIRDAWE